MNSAVEDYDFIRTRLEQLRKEKEEAEKSSQISSDEGISGDVSGQTYNKQVPIIDGDYCVGMGEANTYVTYLT